MALVGRPFREVYEELAAYEPSWADRILSICRDEVCARKDVEIAEELDFADMLHVSAIWISEKKAREKGCGGPMMRDKRVLALYEQERAVWVPSAPPRLPKGCSVGFPKAKAHALFEEEAELRLWLRGVEAKLREHVEGACQESYYILTCLDKVGANEERGRVRIEFEEEDDFKAIKREVFRAAPADFFRYKVAERFGSTAHQRTPSRELTLEELESADRVRVEEEEQQGRRAAHQFLVAFFDQQLFELNHREVFTRELMERQEVEARYPVVARCCREDFGMCYYNTPAIFLHLRAVNQTRSYMAQMCAWHISHTMRNATEVKKQHQPHSHPPSQNESAVLGNDAAQPQQPEEEACEEDVLLHQEDQRTEAVQAAVPLRSEEVAYPAVARADSLSETEQPMYPVEEEEQQQPHSQPHSHPPSQNESAVLGNDAAQPQQPEEEACEEDVLLHQEDQRTEAVQAVPIRSEEVVYPAVTRTESLSETEQPMYPVEEEEQQQPHSHPPSQNESAVLGNDAAQPQQQEEEACEEDVLVHQEDQHTEAVQAAVPLRSEEVAYPAVTRTESLSETEQPMYPVEEEEQQPKLTPEAETVHEADATHNAAPMREGEGEPSSCEAPVPAPSSSNDTNTCYPLPPAPRLPVLSAEEWVAPTRTRRSKSIERKRQQSLCSLDSKTN